MHSAITIGKKMYVFGGAQSTGVRDDTSGFCDLYELDIGKHSIGIGQY